MRNSPETKRFTELLDACRTAEAAFDEYARHYAGSYETLLRQKEELSEAMCQAYKTLQTGAADEALAIIAEALRWTT